MAARRPGSAPLTDRPVPALDVDGGWWALFDAAPVAHALIEVPSGAIRAANQAFFELQGLRPGDLALLDPLSLSHPDDRDAIRDAFERVVVDGRRSVEIEQRFRRRDGSEFWGRLHATRIAPADEGSWLVLGSCTDVSDQVRIRTALEQSAARTTALLAGFSDVVVIIDADGVVAFASPSTNDLLGVPPEEIVGRPAIDVVHPDDATVVAGQLAERLDAPGPHEPVRFRVTHADGRVREVEASSVNLLADPVVEGLVVIVRTVTDEVITTAQDVLRRRYRQMLAHVADRVSLLDANGNAIEELGPGRRSVGTDVSRTWSPEETVARCHPADRDRLVRELGRLLTRAGEQLHDRFTFSDDDGGWMTLELEGINRSEDPDIGATVLTTRDVTDDVLLAREIADARDQAVRALEARSEFVATVSHELRTPIHGILGLSELLSDSDDDEVSRIAGLILRSAESLRLMVDDILDLSKLEAGRLEILPGPLDVVELRDDLVALFGQQAAGRGIEFTVDFDDDFPDWVWGDALRIRQVLTNLLGNAVKFTESGEVRVTVTTEPAPPGIEVDVLARIVVRDTGIGIPYEAQRGIFEPFSAAHARTAHRYGGNGLGLVTTLRLVEALNGTLLFESEPGAGSTFTVLFPLAPLDVDETGRPILDRDVAPTETDVRVGSAVDVLVVEDNPVNQLLVARQLEVLGYSVEVVADGESAVNRFADSPPAAILMDLRLPGIDGIETAERIRAMEADEGLPRTPIVAMTASGLAGDREAAERSGMDGFLSKPVGLGLLRDALTTWCALEPSSPPADEADRPVIDVSVPDQLVEELDDPELVAHLCELFVRELPSRTTAIQDAVGGDEARVRASSHALRSAALTLGASGLVELCERLDAAPPEERGDLLSPLPQLAQATAQQLTGLAARYRSRGL